MEDGTVNGSSGFSYGRSHIVNDAPSSRSSRSPFLRLDYKRQEAALHAMPTNRWIMPDRRRPTGNK